MRELYGKKNDSVGTPDDLYEELKKHFKFNFDPCPLEKPEWDGLEIPWKESNFVNPPFSEIPKWLKKGIEEKKKGNKSVFLITGRTNSLYWHSLCFMNFDDLYFAEKGIRFKGYPAPFPVPMTLVVFDPNPRDSQKQGHVTFGKYRFFRIPRVY